MVPDLTERGVRREGREGRLMTNITMTTIMKNEKMKNEKKKMKMKLIYHLNFLVCVVHHIFTKIHQFFFTKFTKSFT